MEERRIHLPPFPHLQWDKYVWTGVFVLPSWAGFQCRRGPYGSVSSRAKSDGGARLFVAPKDRDGATPPAPEQLQAFQLLLDNKRTVADAVQEAIFAAYPKMRDAFCCSDEEAAEWMPEIRGIKDLRGLIGLSIVHVLNVAKDGVAYLGFEFGCTWDEEHGLGVMTHQERVVKVGGADASFLEWIAERDARPHGLPG